MSTMNACMMSEAALPMTVSDAALAHMTKKVADQKGATGWRFATKKAGCSGFMYDTQVVAKASEGDLAYRLSPECMLYVDPKSLPRLKGLVVDYVSKGIGAKQLVFTNPNQKGQCGCGESFLA